MKVTTIFTFDKNIYQKKYEPSRTIPDDTLTVRQILERHTKGLPINSSVRVPIYDEDNDLPDYRTLDLAERQQYAELYKQELQDIQDIRIASEARKGENEALAGLLPDVPSKGAKGSEADAEPEAQV